MSRFFISLISSLLLFTVIQAVPPSLAQKKPAPPTLSSKYPVLPKEVKYGLITQKGELIRLDGPHWSAYGEWWTGNQKDKTKFVLILHWITCTGGTYYCGVYHYNKVTDIWEGKYCRWEDDTRLIDGVLIGNFLGNDSLKPKESGETDDN